nr:hypothetical protein CFP56_35565 [Quercus suber]
MEAWRSSYIVEARRSSYTMEVRRVVVSMLGHIEYHQRSCTPRKREDVPTPWKCRKGFLHCEGCTEHVGGASSTIKDPYAMEVWRSSYTVEARRVVLREMCLETTQR